MFKDITKAFNTLHEYWLSHPKNSPVHRIMESDGGYEYIELTFREGSIVNLFDDQEVESYMQNREQIGASKKQAYYLQPGDNVRSLAPLVRGKVDTNSRGLVQQIDPNGKFVMVQFPDAGIEGWVKVTDLETIAPKFKDEPRPTFRGKPRRYDKRVGAKAVVYPAGYAQSLVSDAYDKGIVFDIKVIGNGVVSGPADEIQDFVKKYNGQDYGNGQVKVTKMAKAKTAEEWDEGDLYDQIEEIYSQTGRKMTKQQMKDYVTNGLRAPMELANSIVEEFFSDKQASKKTAEDNEPADLDELISEIKYVAEGKADNANNRKNIADEVHKTEGFEDFSLQEIQSLVDEYYDEREVKAKKVKALDQFGKNYWQKYLKGTGLGEQVMKVAFNKVEELMKIEDTLPPNELRSRYASLSKEFEKQGGFNFVRAIRQELIATRITEEN